MVFLKLKLNSVDRVSGDSNNARIPVQTSVSRIDEIVSAKLESTSPIVLSTLKSLYIVCPDIPQANSYDTNKTNGLDNQVLGIVPFVAMSGSNYVYQATDTANFWFDVETVSKLSSSIVTIMLVEADGTLVSTSDFSLTLVFRGED